MDFRFNDEETDQSRSYPTTAQSSYVALTIPPGSLTSSDDLFSGHNHGFLNAQLGSSSSAATSWGHGHQLDPGLINAESAQSTVCPEIRESDLDGIGLTFNQPEAIIPQQLDLDSYPGSGNVSFQPPWFYTSPQTTLHRTMMGMPQQTPSSLHQSEHQLNQINTTYRALETGQSCSYGDIIMAAKSTTGALHDFFSSKLAANPLSSNESEGKGKEKGKDRAIYQCFICDVQKKKKKKKITIGSFGSLKRHLSAVHEIGDSVFRCLHCNLRRIFYRRDRLREHLTYAHKQVDLQDADVEATRIPMPPPPACPICSETVQSWEEFFRHIKKHCLVRSGSVGGSTKDDRSRHGDNGRGNGRGNDGNGNGSSFAGPSNGSGQPPSYHGTRSSNQANSQHGNYLGPGPFPGNFMSRSKANSRPGPIMHSVSDDQLNISHLGDKNNTEEFSMDDVFDAPFDSSFHVAECISQQLNHSRPPQNLGVPQLDLFSQKRKRSIKPKEATKQKFLSPRKCMRCDHDLGKCQRCARFTESVRHCHKCTDARGVAVQTGSSSKTSPQTRQGLSSTIDTLKQPNHGMAMRDFELYPNMLAPSIDRQSNEAVQYRETQTQRNSLYNSSEQPSDDTSPTDSFIGVAMVVEDHRPLSGVQSKIQESPVFGCDLGLLRSIGLSSLIEPCSPKSQAEQTKKKAPIGLSPGSYTDLVLRNAESSPKLQAPEPVSQCQWPCVSMPTMEYRALTSAQLSPSERVEMTFKMLPAARETSHPLRTRVQVVVKLLRLRSSISKPHADMRQRNQSITSENNSEADVQSNTDSDHEISATSPSGLENAPVPLWTEDVQDWSFELDIKWALTKLAQWPSGVNSDTCSKRLLSDPSHIPDLISMYFIDKFRICW